MAQNLGYEAGLKSGSVIMKHSQFQFCVVSMACRPHVTQYPAIFHRFNWPWLVGPRPHIVSKSFSVTVILNYGRRDEENN